MTPIDPRIASDAGRIVYDDTLTTDERRDILARLVEEGKAEEGEVSGYMEMLSKLDSANADELRDLCSSELAGSLGPEFVRWSPHPRALKRVEECGALEEVEAALREVYTQTQAPKRLKPSSEVEKALKRRGWLKVKPASLGLPTGKSMDGFKHFSDGTKVGLEVEWPWERVVYDLVKFWHAQKAEQIDVGIEVLRGLGEFCYVTRHIWQLHEDLFSSLEIVFCGLAAPDLNEQKFPKTT